MEKKQGRGLECLAMTLGLGIGGTALYLAGRHEGVVIYRGKADPVQVKVPPLRRAAHSFSLDEGTAPLMSGTQLSVLGRILTERDTQLLRSYGVNGTQVHQYLDFQKCALKPGYYRDERDEVGHFLKGKQGSELFTYQLDFENGLRSHVDAQGNLVDIIGKEFQILGEHYVMSSATKRGDRLVLELDGPRKLFLREPLRVVRGGREGLTADSVFIDGEFQSDIVPFKMRYGMLQANDIELRSITMTVLGDAILGDIYVPVNGRLSSELIRKTEMLANTWDLEFKGPRDNGSYDLRFVEK